MLYPKHPDFEAEVRFLTPEEGGRRYGPVKQGYRCDVHWPGEPSNELWMIWPVFLDQNGNELPKEAVVPSLSKADFYIVNDKSRKIIYENWLRVGVDFHLHEGAKKVAACRITKVFPMPEDAL
jgi:hypothetical protein